MKPTDKTCDKLWTKAVLRRSGGKCEKCGKDKGIQAHHIIPRTCWALRFDLENGVALCIKHHLYWAHKDALEFGQWIKTKRDIEYLESKRHNRLKNDYQAIQMYLNESIGSV